MQAPASFYVDEQVRIDVWSGSHDVQLVVVDPAGIKRGCAEVLLERDHEVCIVDMSGGIIPGPHTAMLYKDGYLLQDLIFMVEIRQTLEKPKKITEVDVTIEVNGTEKVEVNITGKEAVQVPAGYFKCLRIEPVSADGTPLLKNNGEMRVWLSDDTHKLPVKIELKTNVGNLVMKLKEVTTSEY